MDDYDVISETEEDSNDDIVEEEEEEENEDDYYHRGRSYWEGYDDHECKKCKTDDAYEFVTINPVILTGVPTLQEFATVSIAASLWNHINIPRAVFGVTDRCTKKSQKWKDLCASVLSLIDKLPVPNALTKPIKKIIGKMSNEITNWASYHYRRVFLENGIDKFVYNHIYHIVWYPNGAINCEQTARSMLTSLRLSEVDKFKFLCTYCLKEEMEELSPLLYLDSMLEYVSMRSQPLIYYWYRYFRNVLEKLDAAVNRASNLSLDIYMFQHTNVDNWPAKEYFFNRLSPDEQVRQAIWLINKYAVVYQKAVLMKLDETQRSQVYIDRAVQIMINYARPRVSSKLILSTWFDARHLITEDQLFSLFCLLLPEGINDTILTVIWTSAPEHFKNYVVCFNDYEIVGQILLNWKRCNDSDFIFTLLQDSSISVKKDIITKNFFAKFCENLLTHGELQRLDRLLEFMRPDAQECMVLKQNLVNDSKHVKNTCLNFYSSGDVDGLNNYLNQLMQSSPDFVIEYRKTLLNSSEGLNKCISLMGSKDGLLEVIIGNSLLDANAVKEFKRKMILSSSAITKLRDLLHVKNLTTVQSCIRLYLTLPEDKTTLKQQLFGDLMQTIRAILSKNDESYLQTVMVWGYGNKNVQKFKETINLDSVFIDMLKDCIFTTYDYYLTKCSFKYYCHSSDFEAVGRFLNWYFQSPTKAKEYKMNMIRSYKRIEMFSTLLRGNRGDSQLKTMMKWFFQNDAEEIAKFKLWDGCTKIGGMI